MAEVGNVCSTSLSGCEIVTAQEQTERRQKVGEPPGRCDGWRKGREQTGKIVLGVRGPGRAVEGSQDRREPIHRTKWRNYWTGSSHRPENSARTCRRPGSAIVTPEMQLLCGDTRVQGPREKRGRGLLQGHRCPAPAPARWAKVAGAAASAHSRRPPSGRGEGWPAKAGAAGR